MASKRPPGTRIGIPCLVLIGMFIFGVAGLSSLGVWLA